MFLAVSFVQRRFFLDYKQKIIEILKNKKDRYPLDSVVDFKKCTSKDEAAKIDDAIIELLDSDDPWLLDCAISLCGFDLKIYTAKQKLLSLAAGEKIRKHEHALGSLFAAFSALEVKESLEYAVDYLDSAVEDIDAASHWIAALSALISCAPDRAPFYIKRIFVIYYIKSEWNENFGAGWLMSTFVYPIWWCLSRLDIDGLKALEQEFDSVSGRCKEIYESTLKYAVDTNENFKWICGQHGINGLSAEVMAAILQRLR